MYDHDGRESITEIDSHANMVVFGKHDTVLDDNGKKMDVRPFKPYYQDLEKVSVLYMEVQYTCK